MEWEYTTIKPISAEIANTLNALGYDGWELVAVHDDIAYLKRPRVQEAIAVTREPLTQEQVVDIVNQQARRWFTG